MSRLGKSAIETCCVARKLKYLARYITFMQKSNIRRD
jgi:hypothetical protein